MTTSSRLFRRLSERVCAFAGRLRRDQSGAIAVQFAFLAIPLSILVFALVDVGRVSLQRRQMQDALDASTLIAARSTAVTNADLNTVGDAAFLAEVAGLNLGVTASNANFASGANNTVVGTATVTMKPIIANLWTNSNMTVTATSTVVRSVNRLEVALVLDNTGSMNDRLGSGGSKISALKTASKSLVTTLAAAAARSSDANAVKISVVPFSMTVNVGSTYQNASWITGTQPASYGGDIFATSQNRFTLLSNLGLSWGGCVESRPDPYDTQDTGSTSGTGATMFVPFFAPDEPDDNVVPIDSWNNYLDGRTNYYGDIQNNWLTDTGATNSTDWFTRQNVVAKYAASNKSSVISDAKTGTDYGPNAGCNIASLLRLTNLATTAGVTTVNGKLDQMVANGNTNIAMGLMWGWHTLSPNTPFADGAAYSTPKTQKIIVLLTDGDNTNDVYSNPNASIYTGYGYIWQGRLKNSSNVALTTSSSGTDRQVAIDSRESKTCTNAKNAGIIIYTIGVGVSTSAKTGLQACASSPDKYYDVTASAQLITVFNTIAGSIQNLRISK
jgi:Flp pilus assembly protein TadG